ncbi:SRPBCC domain-containing protein [Phenylobacterium sp.]|uniref:SRPBCC domain-containing protein n=1 Tax=Phenylobacterium sp. TaxID=1871053 RepID=UPI00356637B8
MEEAPLGAVRTLPDGRNELRFERELPHPSQDVWRAVTSPLALGHWLSEAEVKLEPGGEFRLRGQCNVDGVILEVTPGSMLIWTWPHPDHPRSQVEITIVALDRERSRLTLVQTDLPTQHVPDVAAGWHTHLDALPTAILDKHTPFDAEQAAMHYRRYAAVWRA